ncbi:tRNA (5-methylaminomethyl-2-thiouridine)(34)-methyltransferase MnmD [Flavihumibacter sp. UBA7668]|uniref:tRNA (5-methylaminomethyl-2-thiouridine)(34)-methyltransferase MnmD n=1 Tax=Flavihumibacter sp. UBA7668 TaxID=1946542 RepID=UPI0025C1F8D4|nr:tRNA (5-methylaminomethyl-2-thiouridine)(34)-methyltransferase MnmD [Flavihumibacter sp. UBA7668]
MERIVQATSDGSHTIAVPEMDVTYHSKHGAIQESKHVFIEAGLKYQMEKTEGTFNLFEMGFGTGLNALLTVLENSTRLIRYESLEAFPLEPAMAGSLNYGELLPNKNARNFLRQLHEANWNEWVSITDSFQLCKRNQDLIDFNSAELIDLIYFDAFAPTAQPKLWTESIFRKLNKWMKPTGVLVTYCSKGDVRRAMVAAGLQVEKIPGPPGKREMVRAIKPA